MRLGGVLPRLLLCARCSSCPLSHPATRRTPALPLIRPSPPAPPPPPPCLGAALEACPGGAAGEASPAIAKRLHELLAMVAMQFGGYLFRLSESQVGAQRRASTGCNAGGGGGGCSRRCGRVWLWLHAGGACIMRGRRQQKAGCSAAPPATPRPQSPPRPPCCPPGRLPAGLHLSRGWRAVLPLRPGAAHVQPVGRRLRRVLRAHRWVGGWGWGVGGGSSEGPAAKAGWLGGALQGRRGGCAWARRRAGPCTASSVWQPCRVTHITAAPDLLSFRAGPRRQAHFQGAARGHGGAPELRVQRGQVGGARRTSRAGPPPPGSSRTACLLPSAHAACPHAAALLRAPLLPVLFCSVPRQQAAADDVTTDYLGTAVERVQQLRCAGSALDGVHSAQDLQMWMCRSHCCGSIGSRSFGAAGPNSAACTAHALRATCLVCRLRCPRQACQVAYTYPPPFLSLPLILLQRGGTWRAGDRV